MILYCVFFCLGAFIKFLGFFYSVFYYVLLVLSFGGLHRHLYILKKIYCFTKYTLKCLRIENCNIGGKLIWNMLKKDNAKGTGTKGCPSSLGIGLFCP